MHVDKSLQEKVVRYLKQLGLGQEQALVYIFLLQNGPSTVLAISRGLKTGRTKLYPLLDELAEKQLIAVHERHYGTSYEAHVPEVLEFLVSEHERKADGLRKSLQGAIHTLNNLRLQSPTASKVIEYRGVDGLKQMNWNLTKASKEYRVFELKHLSDHISRHFAEKLRLIWTEKKIISYDLTNDPDWKIDTNVSGYEKLSKARYIDPAVFNIQFETYVYNNCVGLLNYEADDIFGVEIYNDKLAAQQKQLFDLLWSQARMIRD